MWCIDPQTVPISVKLQLEMLFCSQPMLAIKQMHHMREQRHVAESHKCTPCIESTGSTYSRSWEVHQWPSLHLLQQHSTADLTCILKHCFDMSTVVQAILSIMVFSRHFPHGRRLNINSPGKCEPFL